MSRKHLSFCLKIGAGLSLFLSCVRAENAAATPGVALVTSAERLGEDSVQAGASEFNLLSTVARVERVHHTVGIVGVGNRHGLFSRASEQTLRFFALRGMVVVKVAQGSDFVSDPEGLFLDAGDLKPAEAESLLTRCLQRFGAPPLANTSSPSAAELANIREHLSHFRSEFLLAQHGRMLASAS